MDFIAAGEETARDFGQPPSLTSSEGFPVQCTVREEISSLLRCLDAKIIREAGNPAFSSFLSSPSWKTCVSSISTSLNFPSCDSLAAENPEFSGSSKSFHSMRFKSWVLMFWLARSGAEQMIVILGIGVSERFFFLSIGVFWIAVFCHF